ncbi:hypothetical protein JMJ77_0001485, partial [Colletotrichum scovillei]
DGLELVAVGSLIVWFSRFIYTNHELDKGAVGKLECGVK